jgi:hypothetical protein
MLGSKNRQIWLLLKKINALFTTNFSMPIIVWSLAGSVIFGLIYAVICTVNADLAIAIARSFQQLEISLLNPVTTAPAPASIFADLTLTTIKIAFMVAIGMIAAQTFPSKNS